MASETTPINTHASHAVIFEFRVKLALGTSKFSNYIHVAVERDSGWDTGQPSPTFGEMMGGIWSTWDGAWLDYQSLDVSLNLLRMSEVLDYANVGGQPAPVYGDFHEKVDFTGFPGVHVGQFSSSIEYMPSFVSIYVLKQADASPFNVNGSLRLGPVSEEWTVFPDKNRLESGAQSTINTRVQDLLTGVSVTAADGGNVALATMVIMRKTPAVGMAAPWDFVAIPDRLKTRFGLGTQNTRKKTRNTYT